MVNVCFLEEYINAFAPKNDFLDSILRMFLLELPVLKISCIDIVSNNQVLTLINNTFRLNKRPSGM